MSRNGILPVFKPRVVDYLQVAVWSGRDTCYVGSVPPLVGPSSDRPCRDDVAELFRDLDEIAEEYIDIFEKDGLPIPPSSDADTIGSHYLAMPGDHILRCRVLNASRSFLSDGAFQNQVGADQPSFMSLSRITPLLAPDHLPARYLRFSKTLIVPIRGLEPLSNGSFKVIGYHPSKNESLTPSSGAPGRDTSLI